MNESNIRPNADISNQLLETEQYLTDPEFDEDDDIHVCKKCNLAFKDIQKYLAHKVKHDNYKIKYCRSEVDKRMIMPKLVYKPLVKKETQGEHPIVKQGEEKENEEMQKKGKRGRKKQSDSINQDLVIKEKPVYRCNRCDRKFNREATLRRHNEMEHEDKDDDDEEFDDDEMDDDKDMEYKPSIAEIKKEVEEAREETEDMPPLTAEEMAEVVPSEGMDEDQLPRHSEDEAVQAEEETAKSPPVNIHIVGGPPAGASISSSVNVHIVRGPPPKRQKLSEEERGQRKFACHVCGNKFKELTVLKTHMLVHTSRREYACTMEGCTYAFKTKGSLRRHMRRHTGERPFPCEMCGRTFVESGALTRHLRSRVPCTSKTDSDLPRYGKRWGYTPNIPATMGVEAPIAEAAEPVNDALSDSQLDHLQEAFQVGQTVTIAGISVSAGSDTLATVVQVLDSDLPADEQNLIKAVVENANEGQEVVVEHDGCLTDDDSMSQFVQSETEIGSIPTSCKVCNEDFFTIDTLKVHLRTHLADDALKCWLCHFITENKDQFTEHMFTQHAVALQASDPFTTLVVASESEDKDQQDIHKDAQVAVKQLLELPSDPVDGDQEPVEFSTRLMYKCPVCMRKFRGSNYLKLHMRNHTGLRPHKCTMCDKSFITKDTLNKHMSVHVEERNFKCGECGKLFKRLSHVREHIKIHSSARAFPCTICEKSFKTNNAMKVHLRTHTDILPYVCNFCHRRFREKGSVVRHKRIHTGEKPYECKYCGRCFAEHGTLNRHLKAKISCRKSQDETKTSNEYGGDYTVLAEFSSVVADTQKYIVPKEKGAESTDNSTEQDEAQQAAEFVVVQTEMGGQDVKEIQNVEIVTNNDGNNLIEGVQVSDNYIVITDPETGAMKILDSRTGETVAYVPVGSGDEAENGNQTVLVSTEMGTEIEAVAMAPLMEGETEELSTVLAENATCVEIQELASEESA